MDPRNRKRVFSKAFRLPNDPYRKALRSIASSSAASTPQSCCTSTVLFGSDKENNNPFHNAKADFTKPLGGPQKLKPLPLGAKLFDCCSNHQYSGTTSTGSGHGMPLSELGHLQINSSPGFTSDPNSSSPLDDVLVSYPYFESGPAIFEDPDALCSQDDHTDEIIPTALQFRGLSLQDVPKAPRLGSYQSPIAATRTNVFMVESTSLQHCFPNIEPKEVVISFNKGKQNIKIDKYVLSNASRFFAPMLDGTTLEGHTRCIRLRDDFPYAITAMIQYMQDNVYTFDPDMRVKYPNITLLDLHVHAYMAGAKYKIPKLCDHAINEYLNIGKMILCMGIRINENDVIDLSASHSQAASSPTDHKYAQASPVSLVINSFLDSFVLIWSNTPSREDALRDAVMDLLKPQLHQLMRLKFFQTLMMEMVGFGDDIVHSLAEDGFDVDAFPVLAGLQKRGGIRFAGA